MITIKLEGLADLDRALGQFKESTAKAVLRRVGRKALQPFDQSWREKAPVLTGHLEHSGSVGSKLSRSQRAEHERESFVEVFAGPGPNPQAIQQEFGNAHNPPQPFARPAWDETQGQALEIVATELGAEIAKTAARVAKKALR
jgi:HK97 gp10 family phage protein